MQKSRAVALNSRIGGGKKKREGKNKYVFVVETRHRRGRGSRKKVHRVSTITRAGVVQKTEDQARITTELENASEHFSTRA